MYQMATVEFGGNMDRQFAIEEGLGRVFGVGRGAEEVAPHSTEEAW